MISAIILAAGKSTRMGQPKMILPWKHTTVLGQVIETILSLGIRDVIVVTGSGKNEVEKKIESPAIRIIHNEEYGTGEMLSSIQYGLRAQISQVEATLICLGDQPQVKAGSVEKVIQEYVHTKNPLIVPSHQKRRGHPWLVGKELWEEILNLQPGRTMRDFLNQHTEDIHYVEIDTADILQDIDTPDDYLKSNP